VVGWERLGGLREARVRLRWTMDFRIRLPASGFCTAILPPTTSHAGHVVSVQVPYSLYFMQPGSVEEAPARYAVPPTVTPSMRKVGWPTPTGTLWPSLPQTPTPESSRMSLPIIETRFSTSGPLPISVAPLTG
jgi:hypothetical protein